jgi:hypothetical protein
MQLASSESIRALMGRYGIPTPVRPRRDAQNAHAPAIRRHKGRCKCGHCRQCLDDARWERIFAEKFLDPNYYSRQTTHMASLLTSC